MYIFDLLWWLVKSSWKCYELLLFVLISPQSKKNTSAFCIFSNCYPVGQFVEGVLKLEGDWEARGMDL